MFCFIAPFMITMVVIYASRDLSVIYSQTIALCASPERSPEPNPSVLA